MKMNNKPKSKKAGVATILAVVGLVLALLATIIGNNMNNGINQRDTLSVSGTSELSVSPDQAEIYINVITDAKDAKDAQAQNKDATNNVMTALKAAGVKSENIETTGYNLYKKTKWNSTSMDYVETGYELTNTIKITSSDMTNVGDLVDTAINAGANGVDHVTFTLTKDSERKVKAEALIKATAAAKDKATNLASTLDVKLGKVQNVQENNFYYTPYEYRQVANVKMDYGTSSAGNTISPQKVTITSTVSIVYDLK